MECPIFFFFTKTMTSTKDNKQNLHAFSGILENNYKKACHKLLFVYETGAGIGYKDAAWGPHVPYRSTRAQDVWSPPTPASCWCTPGQ